RTALAVRAPLHLFLSRPAGPVLGVGHHFFCPGALHTAPGLALHASWPLVPPEGLPGAPPSCAVGVPCRSEHLPQTSGLCEGRPRARRSPRQRPSGRERQALQSWAQPPHGPSAIRPAGVVIAERAASALWWLRLPPELVLGGLSTAVPRCGPWPLG